MSRSKSKQKRKKIELRRKRKAWLKRKMGKQPEVQVVKKAAPKKKAATPKTKSET